MSNEWQELETMWAVANAESKGMVIEVQDDPGNDKYSPWEKWDGKFWSSRPLYRACPRKPAKVMVKSLCWRHERGALMWGDEACVQQSPEWKRFPAGDREGEVEA
jgi:hypothetical protein